MNDAGHRSSTAVVDIGHGAGNGSRTGDSAEERRTEIGHTLTDELLIGIVVIASHTVGHRSREQGFDGAEYGNDHGRRE